MSFKQQAMPIMVNNYSKLFGVKVRMQGTVAYTNGRVITIPRMDIRDATKARLAYGYLAHESAHVRYSDFSLLREKGLKDNFLLFSIFNILEDCRIETLIAHEYIGVYENLLLLNDYYEAQWQEFFDTICTKTTLNAALAWIQCHAQALCQKFKSSKKRAVLLIRFLRKKHSHRVLGEILKLIKMTVNAKDSSEILSISKDIYCILCEKLIPSSDKSMSEQSQRELTSKNSKLNDLIEDFKKNNPDATDGQRAVELETFALRLQSGDDPKNITPSGSAEKIVEENSNGTQSSSREDFGEFDERICKEGRSDFIKQVGASYGLRQALAHQVRGYVLSHGFDCELGRVLDPMKVQRVCVGERNIFRDRILQKDFTTSVHLLVDVSSSMLTSDGEQSTRAQEACKAALMLSLALEGIDGISSMTTFFPGLAAEFEIALKASERASNVASRFDQKPRGSTPLAQALWYAFSCAGRLECQRNIILVITDGMPDSVSNVHNCFNYAKEHHIEIYGISIRSELITKLFEHAEVIASAKDLSKSAFSLFRKLFAINPDMHDQQRI